MAKIKNIVKYVYDQDISAEDYLIGTDADKSKVTKNYKIGDLLGFFERNSSIIGQNNVFINKKYEGFDGNFYDKVEDAVNSNPVFTIAPTEIYIITNTFINYDIDSLTFATNHYVFMKGAGTYGLGEPLVTPNDFFFIRGESRRPLPVIGLLTPKVENIIAIDITNPSDAVNTSLDSYNVVANRDSFFIITENTTVVPAPSMTYRFVGALGNYGAGGSLTVPSDFLLVEDNSNPNTTPLELIAANVGYINGSITNVQQALDLLLYTAPDISNFNITPNVVEIGTTVTAVDLSWALNKVFTDLQIDNGVGVITPSLTSLNIPSLSLVANTTFTITGGDGTNTDAASATLNFRAKRWWGTSPLATFTGADILNLQNSELSTNRQQVRTFNGGGQYMWFAFPVSYGLPTFLVNGLPSTAYVTETVSHTNESGHTQNYYVTRTITVQNGTLTTQIL
jgi:hypothetical protein